MDYGNIVILCVVLATILVCIYVWILACKRKIVKENSKYYNDVINLNNVTSYNRQICDVRYIMCVKSKAQFERTAPEKALEEYLTQNRRTMLDLLDEVQKNRRSAVVYYANFNSISTQITPEECRKLHIKYDKFLEIEKQLVNAIKLDIVQTISATCYVQYTSPKGRNHYSKNCTFLESEIRTAIKDLDELNAHKLTEEWRRKTERTKVTVALRYDILKRDHFCCCVCGRSATNGVELEVDHIIPISKGGKTTYQNLQTLCRDCNRGKGAKM